MKHRSESRAGTAWPWRAAAVLAVGAAGLAFEAAPAAAQSWRTVTMSRQQAGERDVDVRVEYGAGRLRVHPLQGGDLLYRMRLRYDEETEEPKVDFTDRRLVLGIDGTGKSLRLNDRDQGEMEVELARGLPMDLRLEFGAGRADMDLGGLALTGLRISTGASESRIDVSRPNPEVMDEARLEVGAADFTARNLGNLNARHIDVSAGVGDVTLEFTGQWRRDASVSVEMGLGSLQLRFPRGIGVKLEKNTFLTSLDTSDMVRRGGAWYSEDWEEADRRITVEVEAAFGSIDIDWVR